MFRYDALDFGRKLKAARYLAGFNTQQALADATTLSRNTISAIEGGRAIPRLDHALEIAGVVDLSLDSFQ